MYYELYVINAEGNYSVVNEGDYALIKSEFKKLKRMFLNEDNNKVKILKANDNTFSYQKITGEITTIGIDTSTADYNF